jgi:hypothetical protein
MPSVTNKPFTLTVTILNVIMVSVLAPLSYAIKHGKKEKAEPPSAPAPTQASSLVGQRGFLAYVTLQLTPSVTPHPTPSSWQGIGDAPTQQQQRQRQEEEERGPSFKRALAA